MKKILNVLIACEESQAICKEFRRLGHNAYSCDIQECSGGYPEWHIMYDALYTASACYFFTQDGVMHFISSWDLIIAHPPCTYLAKSGLRWCDVSRYGEKAKKRQHEQEMAIEFFMKVTKLNCEHMAIENPIGIMSEIYREPDQIIQPWNFGDPVRKSTCLWLKNLPPLELEVTAMPVIEQVTWIDKHGHEKHRDKFFYDTRFLPTEERRKQRSKTFPGIARAIAEQWSAYITYL